MEKSIYRISLARLAVMSTLALNLASCGRDGQLYLEEKPSVDLKEIQKEQDQERKNSPEPSKPGETHRDKQYPVF